MTPESRTSVYMRDPTSKILFIVDGSDQFLLVHVQELTRNHDICSEAVLSLYFQHFARGSICTTSPGQHRKLCSGRILCCVSEMGMMCMIRETVQTETPHVPVNPATWLMLHNTLCSARVQLLISFSFVPHAHYDTTSPRIPTIFLKMCVSYYSLVSMTCAVTNLTPPCRYMTHLDRMSHEIGGSHLHD